MPAIRQAFTRPLVLRGTVKKSDTFLGWTGAAEKASFRRAFRPLRPARTFHRRREPVWRGACDPRRCGAGAGLLDQVLSPSRTDVSRGVQVLGQIFGSKDMSRAVAQNASAQTGPDANLLKKVVANLAMLVVCDMAKQGGAGAETQGSRARRTWHPAGRSDCRHRQRGL